VPLQKKKITMNIIFTGATPINIMKSSYASKLCIKIHMLALLHSIIDRGEHEKYLFLPLFGIMKYSAFAPTIE